jgi:hypothetical protein
MQKQRKYKRSKSTSPKRASGYLAGTDKEDKLGVLGIIGSVLLPPVGLVIWAVDREQRPKAARSALTISLVMITLGIVAAAARK